MPLRVLHLVGSALSEFYADLSRLYAQDCLESTADPSRYEFHIAFVTPDRQWRFPDSLTPDSIASAPPMSLADAILRLEALRVDVALPQMFCLPGMTTFRALLDLLEIPYVGNPPAVMALGAHKATTRVVVAAAGVNVPVGELLRPGDRPRIPPPAVVKPVDTDNSLGVSLVRRVADYDVALRAAFARADEALVEEYVELGREVRCGVVVQNGELICLPLEEYRMDSTSKPIRDHEDKLDHDTHGELYLVAKESIRSWIVDPADPITARVWEAARLSHVALGCRHYSLFDFRIDPDGEPWFLEAGLYCSFAKQSVIPTMARAAGMPLDQLLQAAIAEALVPTPPSSPGLSRQHTSPQS